MSPVEKYGAGDRRRATEWEAAIGQQVRELRRRAHLTQDDLARRANIDTSTVRRLEAGKGGNLTSLVEVLRALGRDDWLATLAPRPTVSPMEALHERKAGSSRARRRGPRAG